MCFGSKGMRGRWPKRLKRTTKEYVPPVHVSMLFQFRDLNHDYHHSRIVSIVAKQTQSTIFATQELVLSTTGTKYQIAGLVNVRLSINSKIKPIERFCREESPHVLQPNHGISCTRRYATNCTIRPLGRGWSQSKQWFGFLHTYVVFCSHGHQTTLTECWFLY